VTAQHVKVAFTQTPKTWNSCRKCGVVCLAAVSRLLWRQLEASGSAQATVWARNLRSCCQDTKGAPAWQPLESAAENRRCLCGSRCRDGGEGWRLWARDHLQNPRFSSFNLQITAPSSVCSTAVVLLAVPEIIHLGRGASSPWGSQSHCSSGALGCLLQPLPWCTLQPFYKTYIGTHPAHRSWAASHFRGKLLLLQSQKNSGSKGCRSSPKSQNRSQCNGTKGKILQIPGMTPNLWERALGFKAFYCRLLKLPSSHWAIVRENV